MAKSILERTVYRVNARNGMLEQQRATRHGSEYTHRIGRRDLSEVLHTISEKPDGFNLDELAAETGIPSSACNVALSFCKERGIVERGPRRRCYGTQHAYLDGMLEYYALLEKGGEI